MAVDIVRVQKYLNVHKEIEEYQCTWIYKVERDRRSIIGRREDSPTFRTGEYAWDIEVFYDGYDKDSADYVGVRLFLRSSEAAGSNFKAVIKLSIIDKNNEERFKQNLTRSSENLKEHCFKNLVNRYALLSSSDLLPNDELKLLCRISCYLENHARTEIIDTPWSTLNCRNSQMMNFSKIFDNPEYSDFQLVIGDTRIKVHRCILAAHSSVFAVMFHSDMLEKNKNEVTIKDVDVKVMRQLLRFIYVGEVENIDDFADELFIAADKYDLDKLKELCEYKLIEKLSLHNLYETLQFVDKFEAAKLKDASIGFIIQNSKKLTTMEDFKKSIETLSTTLLAQVICAFMAKSE